MITISVWRSFEWKTLTLRWHAKCADPALSPGVAIRRAASVLEGEYLAVKVLPNEDALHFRHSWFNLRRLSALSKYVSRLDWLLAGRVAATRRDGDVTVVASGSVALLLFLPVLICALVYFKYRSATLLIAGALLVVTAVIYVAVSDALETLTTDALKHG